MPALTDAQLDALLADRVGSIAVAVAAAVR